MANWKSRRRFPAESGIIYCFTRKQVNDLAAVLRTEGFAAAAYHGGTRYRLSVTDPGIEADYLVRDMGEYPVTSDEAYVTVSLSEPCQGFCYKLAAAILTGL